jgi:hypothetical protein
MHVDASSIALGVVLEKPGARDIDHSLAFASRKLSKLRLITLPLREKGYPWCTRCRNISITCWNETLKCSLTSLC